MKEYKENSNKNYDFVIQLRFDLFFHKKINFTKNLKNRFLCIPRQSDSFQALHDFLFISSYDDAILFSKLYDHIFDYSIRSPFASREHLEKCNIEPFYYFNLEDVMVMRQYLNLSKFGRLKIFIKRKLNLLKAK